jgi:hypothetical protein
MHKNTAEMTGRSARCRAADEKGDPANPAHARLFERPHKWSKRKKNLALTGQ